MILRGLSRPMALATVGCVSFLLAMVMLPLTLLPALVEEGRWSQYLPGYMDYLRTMASFRASGQDALVVVGAALAWAALCVGFLAPIVGPPRAGSEARSLVPSVIAAAFLGALLCLSAWVGVVEALISVFAPDEATFETNQVDAWPVFLAGGLVAWAGGGLLWMKLLRSAAQARDPRGLDRVIRWMFAGTAVELVLGLPLYLIARKKQSCYCALATFWGLVLGIATLLWMCGPWAVLLFTRKARSEWSRGACAKCGYPRRTDAAVCPECGEPARAR